MSQERKPIFTLVKRGSAYESRHETPERDVKMEPESPPVPPLASPTARLRKQLQSAIHSLVLDAKDNDFMARTTVSFGDVKIFTPLFF